MNTARFKHEISYSKQNVENDFARQRIHRTMELLRVEGYGVR